MQMTKTTKMTKEKRGEMILNNKVTKQTKGREKDEPRMQIRETNFLAAKMRKRHKNAGTGTFFEQQRNEANKREEKKVNRE